MKRRAFLTLLGLAPISAAVAASGEAGFLDNAAINHLTADKIEVDTHAFRQITKTTYYLTVGDEYPVGYPGHRILPGEAYYDWRRNEFWARDESGWSKIEWVRI